MGTSAALILQLIIQYGIPGAEAIYADVKSWEANKQDPTAADWAALRAKVSTPYSYFVPTPVVPATPTTTV
jgi:hypothetical protein